MDVEVDRLSSLPDFLIYKILSFVDIVYSIRLCVLSSRWRLIWTSMPNLNFYSREVCRSSPYYEFVNNVLSSRNNKIDVSSVSLDMVAIDGTESSVKRILEYALSHNVQKLTIYWPDDPHQISPSLFSSKSLKHLTMSITTIDYCSYSPWDLPALTTLHLNHVKVSYFPWDLPALTTLHLQFVTLYNCSSILAMCQNLKNLTLERCEVYESGDFDGGFSIINTRLLDLKLKKVSWHVDFLLVDTPQLKNLICVDAPPRDEYCRYSGSNISELSGGVIISAPDLTYLLIKGACFPKISLDGSVEKVDLCISSPQKTDVHKICDLFQRLHSLKSLALSLEIVELLSSSVEVISHQPSALASLTSLKVYPLKSRKIYPFRSLDYCLLKNFEINPIQLDEEQAAMEINLSTEVRNYLLHGSPNATFTVVSHEEARAIKVTKGTNRLMSKLRDNLHELEAYIETGRADVEWKKTADSCRGDFKMKIRGWGRDNERIFCTLLNVKELLNKVHASKRAEMQACFNRLCAEAEAVTNKIMDDMKNRLDRKRCILSGFYNEVSSS